MFIFFSSHFSTTAYRRGWTEHTLIELRRLRSKLRTKQVFKSTTIDISQTVSPWPQNLDKIVLRPAESKYDNFFYCTAARAKTNL